MEIPKKYFKDGKNFELIKEYKYFGLYQDENGIRECFSPFDLGLVEKKFSRIFHKNSINYHF